MVEWRKLFIGGKILQELSVQRIRSELRTVFREQSHRKTLDYEVQGTDDVNALG